MAQVTIVGGPFDGLTAAGSSVGTLAHLELVVVRRTGKGADTELYELVEDPDSRMPRWSYAGGRKTVCGCGASYRRAEGGAEDQGCPLCGAKATR